LSKFNETLTANASWNEVQILQILWKSRKGVYIPHFGQILVKISVLRVLYTLIVAPMGWNLARRRPVPNKISPPSVQRVAPQGRKTSRWASWVN